METISKTCIWLTWDERTWICELKIHQMMIRVNISGFYIMRFPWKLFLFHRVVLTPPFQKIISPWHQQCEYNLWTLLGILDNTLEYSTFSRHQKPVWTLRGCVFLRNLQTGRYNACNSDLIFRNLFCGQNKQILRQRHVSSPVWDDDEWRFSVPDGST